MSQWYWLNVSNDRAKAAWSEQLEEAGMGGIWGCNTVKDHTGDRDPFDIHFHMFNPLPTLQLLLPLFQNEFGPRIHFLSQEPKEGMVELWPKWKGLIKSWHQMERQLYDSSPNEDTTASESSWHLDWPLICFKKNFFPKPVSLVHPSWNLPEAGQLLLLPTPNGDRLSSAWNEPGCVLVLHSDRSEFNLAQCFWMLILHPPSSTSWRPEGN